MHFAGDMDSPSFWKRSVMRTASAYDLSKVKPMHVGTEGADWCKKAGDCFLTTDIVGHLDPWHLKRRIYSSLRGADDASECWRMCQDGRIEDALLIVGQYDACDGAVAELSGYIVNNAETIGVPGPSLGTIECDNATIYKSRLAGRCAWSKKSLQAMCACLSHKASGARLPESEPKSIKRTVAVLRKSLPLRQARRYNRSVADTNHRPDTSIKRELMAGAS